VTNRRQFLRTVGVGAAGFGLFGAACTGTDGADAESDDNSDNLGFSGTVLGYPLAKPTVTFTDTSGQPYNIAEKTDGKLTLLFFGYTSCPDVCPVTLGIVAATLKRLTGPASKANVLFVGVDTARDTPQAMRAFLDRSSEEFVGLTATPELIDQALTELQLPAPVIDDPNADEGYVVGHASQVLVFSPNDNLAHIIYPFGNDSRGENWSKDLPRLQTYEFGDTAR